MANNPRGPHLRIVGSTQGIARRNPIETITTLRGRGISTGQSLLESLQQVDCTSPGSNTSLTVDLPIRYNTLAISVLAFSRYLQGKSISFNTLNIDPELLIYDPDFPISKTREDAIQCTDEILSGFSARLRGEDRAKTARSMESILPRLGFCVVELCLFTDPSDDPYIASYKDGLLVGEMSGYKRLE